MYAVIETGNKQYRVELGTEIQVDRLDVAAGDSITLDRVLLVADGDATAIGRPLVEGATVSADVLRQERGDKIVVFKYKPKARTRVKKGFRAELTTLRISEIAFAGRSASQDAQQAEAEEQKAAQEAEKAAAAKAAADIELAAKLAAASEAASSKSGEADAKPAKAKASKAKSSSPKKAAVKAAPDEAAPDEAVARAEADATAATETPAEAEASDVAEDTKKDE